MTQLTFFYQCLARIKGDRSWQIRVVLRFILCWVIHVALLPMSSFGIELRNSNRASLFADKATELEIFGSDLRDEQNKPALIWTSFPALTEVLEPEGGDRGRLRVRITPEQPIAGMVAIRAFHQNEVSQALLFFVDSQLGASEPRENDEPFRLPVAFDFQSKGLGEHRIPLLLTEGQSMVAEVLAHRLVSDVDPMLIMQNSDGEEVALSDDDAVVGSDPILRFQPKASGIYHLIVRDVQYRGGVRMFLRVGETGIAATAYPNTLQIGQTRQVAVVPLDGFYEKEESFQEQNAMAISSNVSASGLHYFSLANRLVPMVQTSKPVVVEEECNVLPTPSVYCGRLVAGNPTDDLTLSLRKDAMLTVKMLQTGGPLVGHVKLFRGEDRVAEHHWGLDFNGYLRYKVPETGTYQLQVRDCLDRTGTGMEYALSIDQQDVMAVLKLGDSKKRKKLRNERPHRLAIQAGEILEMNIRVDRRGLQGPIRISAWLDGLPCSLEGQIGADKSDADLSIKIPMTDQEMGLKKLVIRGHAIHEGSPVEIPLDLSEHLGRDYAQGGLWPNMLDGVTLVVSPPDQPEDETEKE